MSDPYADIKSMPLEYGKIISAKEMNADWDLGESSPAVVKTKKQAREMRKIDPVHLWKKGDKFYTDGKSFTRALSGEELGKILAECAGE